jgi:hypothetical protein
VGFEGRILGLLLEGLLVGLGIETVVGSVDAGHGGYLVQLGISPLNISVDLCLIVLYLESLVVVQINCYESFADILSTPAPKLLDARQLKHLQSCNSFGWIEFE